MNMKQLLLAGGVYAAEWSLVAYVFTEIPIAVDIFGWIVMMMFTIVGYKYLQGDFSKKS